MERGSFPKHYVVMEKLGCFQYVAREYRCRATNPDKPTNAMFACDLQKDHEGPHASMDVDWECVQWIWEQEDVWTKVSSGSDTL